ncbi:MAG: hypothetical protein M1420_06450 [Actinobacteria bacterium]|nr:hypothetical protein [Actinomycetota bacterium]
MHNDFERCYRAVHSKDARFDGWFVTAVLTTRIYCRPSCPARSPLARNVAFYPTAAAAQHAGFRACKRCRPDASPGSPEWDMRQDVVARAMRLIADGAVDREGVCGLASRLGYSARQLERHLKAEVGAGADRERARHQLAGLGGIGPWTTEVIAMRALGDPDAFPATDMGVVKGAAVLGLPATPAALITHSRRWQPWRSYAVQYLWATQDHPINHWTAKEPPCP